MSYPTPQDLRERLPEGGGGLTDAQLQALIDARMGLLLEPGQSQPQDSALAEQYVLFGALGDATDMLFGREGYDAVPRARSLWSLADTLLARYRHDYVQEPQVSVDYLPEGTS